MKKYRLNELPDTLDGHFLKGIIPGKYLCSGGLSFKKPNHRSHDTGCDCPSCDGNGKHIHNDDSEVFVILQGKAKMEINGTAHPVTCGDVIVCEPGEDHHLVSDSNDPCVNLFFHASDQKNPDQLA